MNSLLALKQQRHQALADLRKLKTERNRSLKDPHSFVQSLFLMPDIIPPRQNVAPPPAINFECYEKLSSLSSEPPKVGEVVRGRKYTPLKPITFNRPWTYEEQKKLQQLLIEHPDEPVSAYRWERIARALGNRTPKQVGSRVQKYFIRLAQAGLPVPGRIPNLQSYTKEKNVLTTVPKESRAPHVYTRHINYYEAPVVKIADEILLNEDQVLDKEELIKFAHLRDSNEYKELIRLRILKKQQESSKETFIQVSTDLSKLRKGNLSCHGCNANPIVGHAYGCKDCTPEEQIILCQTCYDRRDELAEMLSTKTEDGSPNNPHTVDHHFELENYNLFHFVDTDYMITDEMNYLDPDFLA